MKNFLGKGILLITLFAIVAMPGLSWARQIDCSEALPVGQNFINETITRSGGWGEDIKIASVGGCTELRRNDRLLGYYLPVYPKGYIVVSLLTQLSPIKSYSTTDSFDLNSDEGYVALLRDSMDGVLSFIETNYGPLALLPEDGIAPKTNKEEWNWHLGQGMKPALLDQAGNPVDTVVMGGLTATTWGQGVPYNNLAPAGDGGTTVTGCVATAAAQIMKYWEYPYVGVGSKSYTWDGDQSCGNNVGGGTLSTTFSSHIYDWANMLNSYSGSYNSTQVAAVAQLMYDAGVAWEMQYGYCSSGAYTADGVTTYPTYFGYANTTIQKNRTSYANAAAWFAEIRKEFDNLLPRIIHYRIYTHSIVCDGYQTGTTNYIHLNYGWSGGSNNWYAVDNLYCPWSGCSYTEEYIVTGIQPKNRRYLYVKGMDNNIYLTSWLPDGTPTGSYTKISGQTTKAPAIAVFNNKMYIAVKGAANNNIYWRTRDSHVNLSPWNTMTGTTPMGPALVTFNNKLYLFVRGSANDSIYYRSMNSSGTWGSWATVPDSHTSHRPGLAVYNNQLYVYQRGNDGNIYLIAMSDSGTWGSWAHFPSGTTDVGPSVAVYNSLMWVFHKGLNDNKIYYTTTNGVTWPGAWYTMNGRTVDTPAVTVVSFNTAPSTQILHLVVKGADNNRIYYREYNQIDAVWTAWQVLPSGQTDKTPALSPYYFLFD